MPQFRVIETEYWSRTTWVEADTPEQAANLVMAGEIGVSDTEYIGNTDDLIDVFNGTELVAQIERK